MTNTKLQKILPSAFELISLIFLAIGVILLGNSHQLLSYYGLTSSNEVIKGATGTAVNHGLGRLDGFGFTDTVVTFLIWSLVGVLCFSVVRGMIGAYQEAKFDEKLSTSKYVHPSTFTKAKLWRQVSLDFFVLILSLVVTTLFVFGLIAYVLPTAMTYSRTFLIGFAVADIGYLLLALAIVYVWLVFLDVCLRIVSHHRQLTATS